MTDDLAKLIERLEAPNTHYTSQTGGDADLSRYIQWLLQRCSEAAEALSRLSGERDELEATVRRIKIQRDNALNNMERFMNERDEAIERAASKADAASKAYAATITSQPSMKLKYRTEGMSHGAALLATAIRQLKEQQG